MDIQEWVKNIHNPLFIIYGSIVRTSTGERFICKDYPMIIGFAGDANAQIVGAPSVSRHHAQIEFDFNHFKICDLGSENGTYLNGKKLTPNVSEVVEEGDEIKLGDEEFVFEVWD